LRVGPVEAKSCSQGREPLELGDDRTSSPGGATLMSPLTGLDRETCSRDQGLTTLTYTTRPLRGQEPCAMATEVSRVGHAFDGFNVFDHGFHG
jgi:hypothetical protein